MSDVTYNSTKSEIWAHCKDLRKQLAKTQRAPKPQAEEPVVVSAEPVDLVHDVRASLTIALDNFQAATLLEEELRDELHSVHGVTYEGPSTLSQLCARYTDLIFTNKLSEESLATDNKESLETAKAIGRRDSAASQAELDETIRVTTLQYTRDTTALRESASLARKNRTSEVQAIRDDSVASAEASVESARNSWNAAAEDLVIGERETERILAEAAHAPAKILRAENAGKAQGLAIAQKKIKADSRLVLAERQQLRVQLEEDNENLCATIEAAATRVNSLQERIDNTRNAAITLADTSVTSRSASGALAAVQEIALQQATSPGKK